MTTRVWIQSAICSCAIACGQGPAWVPPDDTSDLASDAGADLIAKDVVVNDLQAKILVPLAGQRCARIGEFVHLEASVLASAPVRVVWSFEREQPGCGAVPLAEQDSPTIHTDAYAMFMWSSSCARDVPDNCGFGQGVIKVLVTDGDGNSVDDQVPFCLDDPAG